MTTDEQPAASADTPQQGLAAPPPPDRWRRPLIGPFTVAQVLAVIAAVVATALFVTLLRAPIGVLPSPRPQQPGATGVPVGPPLEGLHIGDLAPEFTGTTATGEAVELKDLDGNTIRLADLRGRPVWVNFWATWCPPCQEETPVLRDMYEKYADDGLALVAISVQETTADDVRAYVDRYDLGYTVGFDATSAIFHTYKAFVLPTQIFIDRDGVIRHVQLGPVTRAAAEGIIDGLIAD